MTTKLKNFESGFNNIQQANRIIEMMEACKSSQSSFSTVFPCFKESENSTLIYDGKGGYSLYDESNLLLDLPTVTLDGVSGVSYNGLLSASSYRGYRIDEPVFLQDLHDLSGALHRSTDFRQNIKTTYKSVNELRSELDQKMKEIYDPDDQDTYILHNQSIYMTLSWTIIATSVLFYLFAKL